ncbi:MAG: B12-binding domain-containing radical SAM protein [Candidatus Sumerlaeaceae bacterium]|nr:B12-binding domain-containing radical SAM protein [Candidatus Sumerlaeaceae bacterium]
MPRLAAPGFPVRRRRVFWRGKGFAINLEWRMRVLLISLFDEWCFGLRHISSTLKAKGHHTTMAYLRAMPELHDNVGEGDPDGYHSPPASVRGADFRALMELTKKVNPELIGISLSFSHIYSLATEVVRRLRTVSNAKVIVGGADPTANPDMAIEWADIVCVGEGEGAIADLADRMSAKQDYTDVPNLWVKKDGQIFKNAYRALDQELDSVPWADFDKADKFWISNGKINFQALPAGSHLLTNFPIMASRGCPYACTFCCNSLYREMYGNKDYVRLRSVENVLAEIENYVRHNKHTHSIEFFDDVFGSRQDWLDEFAEKYPKRIGRPFFCYTYPAVAKPAFVDAIIKAGVGVVAMGLQTGSQRILKDVYKRNAPRDKTINAMKVFQARGIPVVMDLIGSNPFETEEDCLETLELLLEFPAGSYILHETNRLTFYRNYPITRKAMDSGHVGPFIDGRNVSLAENTPERRFWNAIWQLPQFPAMDREAIRQMTKVPHLREHPEIIESMVKALVETTYIPGTRVRRQLHEDQLVSEVARLQGSRMVKYYFGLKKLVKETLPKRMGVFTNLKSGTPRKAVELDIPT